MLDFSKSFQRYETLVAQVDRIFSAVQEKHTDAVRCKIHCCDCCYAVFDLTLIESVYVNYHFNSSLNMPERQKILGRAENADREFYKIKRRLQKMYLQEGKPPEEVFSLLAEERVRCPLLNDEKLCDLYKRRPITCRVYGIPTSIGGKAHICGMSGFKEGKDYPAVNLDSINDRLIELSADLLQEVGSKIPRMRMSLVPVSAALMTTYDEDHFSFKDKEDADAQAIA